MHWTIAPDARARQSAAPLVRADAPSRLGAIRLAMRSDIPAIPGRISRVGGDRRNEVSLNTAAARTSLRGDPGRWFPGFAFFTLSGVFTARFQHVPSCFLTAVGGAFPVQYADVVRCPRSEEMT